MPSTPTVQRWNHHLHPDIRKDAWTEGEEQQLVAAHRQLGNKWSDIARKLPGELFGGGLFVALWGGSLGPGAIVFAVEAANSLWHFHMQGTVVPWLSVALVWSTAPHVEQNAPELFPTVYVIHACTVRCAGLWHTAIFRCTPYMYGTLCSYMGVRCAGLWHTAV